MGTMRVNLPRPLKRSSTTSKRRRKWLAITFMWERRGDVRVFN